METSLKIFGNPRNFAIRYLPCLPERNYEQPDKYAICHLIINNIIIGNPTEECYLPTWFGQLNRNRVFIAENKNNLYPRDFVNLTEREIFELIIKSNEIEEEFDSSFIYLPQLNAELWNQHTFHLDETTDAFLICYYISDNSIKFIVETKWPKRKTRRIENFIFSTIRLDDFFNVVDEATNFLEVTYPYLRNISRMS